MIVCICQLFQLDAQEVHFFKDRRKDFLYELVMPHPPYLFFCIRRDKIADAPFVVDDFVRLQTFIRAHDGIRVHLHFERQLPDGRYTGFGLILATQHPVADSVGYLDEYGLIRIVVNLISFSLSLR